MKKYSLIFLYIALAIAAAGCGKEAEEGVNEDAIRFVEAWKSINKDKYPDFHETELGTVVLEYDKVEGDGKTVPMSDSAYVYVDYCISDLEGNLQSYSDAEHAKQMGAYNKTYFYGPSFWSTREGAIYAGVRDAIKGMKVGERKKIMVPRWLMSYDKKKDAEAYMNSSSSASETIYEFTIVDTTQNVNRWQNDSIKTFLSHHTEYDGWTNPEEDAEYFYFKSYGWPEAEADSEEEGDEEEDWIMHKDTTVYINYTGRLLNGQVFDTTVERIAKDSGIYSASTNYAPKPVTMSNEYSGIKLGSSSIITGFALTLWNMHPYEKAVGLFTSPLGYASSGSGSMIPPYSPLLFEIELVDKPEE